MKLDLDKESTRVFERQLSLWEVTLGADRTKSLEAYARELGAYDKSNVVGTRDLNRLWFDHILDSLSCLLCKPISRASSLIDIGSGGGVPGVPLHLAISPARTCLLESTGKKAEFLRYVSSRIPLDGLEVAGVRAEELGHSLKYRDSFEAATVRAVASLPVISEYCLPFLGSGGVMVAMKGPLEAKELDAGQKAAEALGGALEQVIQVPFSEEIEYKDRNLVVVRKTRPTPERYPRAAGTPRKKPLGS